MNDFAMPSRGPLASATSVGEALLDEASATDAITRWVANNDHWQKSISDPDAFARQVLQAILSRSDALSEQLVLAEGARQANSQLYAKCASSSQPEREAGFGVLSLYLYPKALRFADGDAVIAADATQLALVNIYRFIGQARNPNAFTGWCLRILFRDVRKLQGKDAHRLSNELPVDEEDDHEGGNASGRTGGVQIEHIEDTTQPNVEIAVSESIQASAFWKCLEACHALNDRARRLLQLIFEEDISIGRIALMWNEKANNLHQVFYRAKKTLRNDVDFLLCLQKIGVAI